MVTGGLEEGVVGVVIFEGFSGKGIRHILPDERWLQKIPHCINSRIDLTFSY